MCAGERPRVTQRRVPSLPDDAVAGRRAVSVDREHSARTTKSEKFTDGLLASGKGCLQQGAILEEATGLPGSGGHPSVRRLARRLAFGTTCQFTPNI